MKGPDNASFNSDIKQSMIFSQKIYPQLRNFGKLEIKTFKHLIKNNTTKFKKSSPIERH